MAVEPERAIRVGVPHRTFHFILRHVRAEQRQFVVVLR
jgi:hypothetical protein